MKRIPLLLALAVLACTRVETPEPISPRGDELVYTANPELMWYSVTDVRSYQVQLSLTEDFAEYTDTVVFVDTSVVILDSLELGGNYYWRVIARNTQGAESEPSAPVRFRVANGVELLTPGPQDSTAWPEFSWKAFSGASSYKLSLSRYQDFRELYWDTTLGTTFYKPADSLAPATYCWRVQGFSATQEVSSPSYPRKLVTYSIEESCFPMYAGFSTQFSYDSGGGTYNIYTLEWDTAYWVTKTKNLSVKSTYTEKGRLYYVLSDTLEWDLGSTFAFMHDSIFSPEMFLGKLYPSEGELFLTWYDSLYRAFWNADTLLIAWSRGSQGGTYDTVSIKRVPEKGVVEEIYHKEEILSSTLIRWYSYILRLVP